MAASKRPREDVIDLCDSDDAAAAPSAPAASRPRDRGGEERTGALFSAAGNAAGAAAPSAAAPSRPRGFRLEERSGDLFSVSDDVSLAHCVAEDLRLGRGIATAFKEKFGGVDDMRAQRVGTGGVASLRRGRRVVYALVTKATSSRCRPTMAALRDSLQALKRRMAADGVTQLAIPRLGCGLDKLEWPAVRALLREVFADTDVSITVYTL
jgi:hypothetical protein